MRIVPDSGINTHTSSVQQHACTMASVDAAKRRSSSQPTAATAAAAAHAVAGPRRMHAFRIAINRRMRARIAASFAKGAPGRPRAAWRWYDATRARSRSSTRALTVAGLRHARHARTTQRLFSPERALHHRASVDLGVRLVGLRHHPGSIDTGEST